MAVTFQYLGMDQVKGPYAAQPAATPYHLYRATLNLSGTYATGGFQIDLCNFFTGAATAAPLTGAREGVISISVNWVKTFGDYYDGTNTLTIQDSSIALATGGSITSISAASTNNLVTLKLFTGTANGQGTGELTNATAVGGTVGILFAVQQTLFGSTVG